MVLRNIKKQDAVKIANLYKVVWEEYEGKISSKFLNSILDDSRKVESQIKKNSIFLVYENSNGKIVGVVRGSIEHGGVAKISILVVDPMFRCKGIGRKLLDCFLKKVKRLGVHRVYLYSHKRLIPAIKLYESVGFKIAAQLPNYWMNEDFLVMDFEV